MSFDTQPANAFTHRRAALALVLLAVLSPGRAQAQQQTPADTLIAEAHYLRARTLTLSALQKNPNDVGALIQRSVLEWAFFRFDDAIASAERAVSLADKSAEAHTQLTNALGAKLRASTAGTFEKMSLARRFRKEADRSLELDPNSADALEDAARFYWEAPGMVGGDKTHAQQLADRLSRIDAARGAALKVSFLTEKDKAKRDAAVESLWKAAVSASPNSADAHAGLSAAYFNEGSSRYALAESEARRAIALMPARVAPYRQLAVLYATTGRWDDLEKTLKQARAAVPDNLSPGYQAAQVILAHDTAAQLQRAEQYLRAYLAQPAEGEEPSHADAHWRLGLILEKEGHRNDAIHELQAAISQDDSLDGAKQDLKRLN